MMEIERQKAVLAELPDKYEFPLFDGRQAIESQRTCRAPQRQVPSALNADKLGEALRRTRLERELTLQQVSDKTGVSVATLSRIERLAFENVKSETLGTLNEWIARNQLESREQKELATPDIVELHLRADKNLNKKTADALANLFRTVYDELASKMKKK